MNKPVVFLDLDDTIFHSTRKRVPDTQDIGAVGRDGRPDSFLSRPQRALLDWLRATTEIVVTTARSLDELSRVRLPFDGWKICTHGAVIIAPDGGLDSIWGEKLRPHLVAAAPDLEALSTAASTFGEERRVDLKVRVVPAGDRPGYLRVRHRCGNVAELYDLIPVLQERLPVGWTLTANGNSIEVLPSGVGKAEALAWLRAGVFADRLVLGAGDALADTRFMARCDFSLLPVESQAFRILAEIPDDVQWKL